MFKGLYDQSDIKQCLNYKVFPRNLTHNTSLFVIYYSIEGEKLLGEFMFFSVLAGVEQRKFTRVGLETMTSRLMCWRSYNCTIYSYIRMLGSQVWPDCQLASFN